jgi:hypothetical protein
MTIFYEILFKKLINKQLKQLFDYIKGNLKNQI